MQSRCRPITVKRINKSENPCLIVGAIFPRHSFNFVSVVLVSEAIVDEINVTKIHLTNEFNPLCVKKKLVRTIMEMRFVHCLPICFPLIYFFDIVFIFHFLQAEKLHNLINNAIGSLLSAIWIIRICKWISALILMTYSIHGLGSRVHHFDTLQHVLHVATHLMSGVHLVNYYCMLLNN